MDDKDSVRKPQEPELVKVNLQWERIDDTPTVYANQLIVSHAGPEFYLIFGETAPIVAGKPEDLPPFVPVKPRIKIAVTYPAMQAFVAVLNENFTHFMQKVERAENEHDDGTPIQPQ